eukprot:3070659-Prymnesium_polylepis.1
MEARYGRKRVPPRTVCWHSDESFRALFKASASSPGLEVLSGCPLGLYSALSLLRKGLLESAALNLAHFLKSHIDNHA